VGLFLVAPTFNRVNDTLDSGATASTGRNMMKRRKTGNSHKLKEMKESLIGAEKRCNRIPNRK
jgi:hypothetical protein